LHHNPIGVSAIRRTYSAILKRISINLDQAGADRLEHVFERLCQYYQFEDMPSMSLVMVVALKRMVEADELDIDALWEELKAESVTRYPRREKSAK
jgi:hypothetical protein